jgi:hypothetical protein
VLVATEDVRCRDPENDEDPPTTAAFRHSLRVIGPAAFEERM